jgi:PAS domain S-box-containing protein
LDLAINGVSDGVWDWNLQTQALYLSPKLKEMAGYAESELPSHTETLAALMHPDDRHEAMQHISACAQGQTSAMHTEFRWRHKDGHWVWILSRGRLVRDAAGLPLRLVGSHTDISRLKQQETELSHQRRRLQDILDGTRAGTWEWNIQTDELVFNERCAEMLGYTLADWHPVSVQTWIQLVHPDDLLLSDQRLSLHLADKEAFYECELRMLHKQGHWAWVQDRGRVARRAADDTPLWMSGTHLDVTERKTQELALRESQHALQQAKDAAEAANLAKSRFLTTMSHEIRTPLNAILGLAQMLQMPQVTEAERTSYAQTVVRSGQTLLALLNDILDLSKVEAGKLELEAQPFVCGELLSDITTLFSEVAHEKGLVLRVLAPPAHDMVCLGDARRLRQMLANLVGNAIKFTARGEVCVAVRMVERNAQTVTLEFSVRDTGAGIDEQTQQRLFKPFEQADSSTTRRFGGTGLGLSIVQQLAHLMGGETGLNSQPGAGSTFWFTVRIPWKKRDTALVETTPNATLIEASASPLRA